MPALPPDYDSDPDRSRTFMAGWQLDVNGPVADRLAGEGAQLVLDVGCGIGRFGSAIQGRLSWVGVDESPRQLADCRYRPVVRADAALLPIGDNCVDAVLMLWMLYHLEHPELAIAEGIRALRPGGLLVACAGSRYDDPELVPGGHAPTNFDAEEAPAIVGSVFGVANVEVEAWDEPLVELRDRDEAAAYARSHLYPPSVAEGIDGPLTLTKRGCLVWARKV